MDSTTPIQTSSPSLRQNLVTRLHTATSIASDPCLNANLRDFINRNFMAAFDPQKWDLSGNRFEDLDGLKVSLGTKGAIAVVYDDGDTPVACAGACAWKGDENGSSYAGEVGWELKAVTVNKAYAKQGLVGVCIETLLKHLGAVEERKKEESSVGGPAEEICLWIQVVEDVNGPYWRRRGWKEIRSRALPVGYWGSYTGFTLLTMVKKFPLDTVTDKTTNEGGGSEQQRDVSSSSRE